MSPQPWAPTGCVGRPRSSALRRSARAPRSCLVRRWCARPAQRLRASRRAQDVARTGGGPHSWRDGVADAGRLRIAWVGMLSRDFSGPAIPDIAFVRRWSFIVGGRVRGAGAHRGAICRAQRRDSSFPAWVNLGGQRMRGIDAMGQRLIMLAAIVVAILLFAVPGAVSGLDLVGVLAVCRRRVRRPGGSVRRNRAAGSAGGDRTAGAGLRAYRPDVGGTGRVASGEWAANPIPDTQYSYRLSAGSCRLTVSGLNSGPFRARRRCP